MDPKSRFQSHNASWENVTVTRNTQFEGVKVDTHIKCSTVGIAEILVDARKNGFGTYECWNESGPDWDLNLGIEKSLKMATEGWASKGSYIQRLADKCAELSLEMPTQQIVRDLAGPIWDMPAVIEGHPYCALNFREAPAPDLIKLSINGFYSCSVKAEYLERRAAAISALVLTLHTAGYALECSLYVPVTVANGENVLVEVTVHNPGEVFDLERLAFWMGHPAAVRNLMFAVTGLFTNGSIGSLPYFDKVGPILAKKAALDGSIYIDSMHAYNDASSIQKCRTEEGSLDWIRGQIERVKAWSLGNLSDFPMEESIT